MRAFTLRRFLSLLRHCVFGFATPASHPAPSPNADDGRGSVVSDNDVVFSPSGGQTGAANPFENTGTGGELQDIGFSPDGFADAASAAG